MRTFTWLLLSALTACASSPATPPAAATTALATPTATPAPSASTDPASASPPAAVVLTADTPVTLTSGATLTVPRGWTMTQDGPRVLLTGPEPDLRVLLVDSPAAAADDAVAAAWKTLHPDFGRTLTRTQPYPARRGWDELRDYDYETSSAEKMSVWAQARRKGNAWTVTLYEGSDASAEKRGADTSRILGSLVPAGYVRESFAGKTAHDLDAGRIKDITDTVDRLRGLAGVPGAAIALVQHGKVVFEGGLGVREVGKPDKVDAHTRFLIASDTKALTTLMLAKLADEGKLRWDTPVASLFPGFTLGDADTTRQIQVKHLICACTGLPRHDAELYFGVQKLTARGEMDLVASFQPTTGFGETFQYSNNLAAVAGFVGGYLAYPKMELGAAYEAAMQSRVFGPLGMAETTFDVARAQRADHAVGYAHDVDGAMAVAPMGLNRGLVATRPSGGAWSTVHDMAKYLALELAKGTLPDGKRYVSEDALLERRKPQVRMGEYTTYGMGLWEDRTKGVSVFEHNGAMPGWRSIMFFVPDADVGGILLVNGPDWSLPGAFVRKSLEVLYDGHPEAEEDAAASIAATKAQFAPERARLSLPPDASLTAKLARRYSNPSLGDLAVVTEGASVVFDVGAWKSIVATRKNDDGTVSFEMVGPGTRWGPSSYFTFAPGESGGKKILTFSLGQQEYVFTESR
jgi:CubicO group peptidase (beta-lactamase class C family)